MKSHSKLSSYEIQIPFSGTIVRAERKTTMTKIIRVLLGLVVSLTFIGNILFILETRKINRDEEETFKGNTEYRSQSIPQSIPQRRDHESHVSRESSLNAKGKNNFLMLF